MKRNVIGVQKDKFIMYLRFLQMIFNGRYLELEKSGNILELKPMGPTCFGALTSKKGTEKKFEGLIPLEKFGQFAEIEDVAVERVLHVVQGATEEEPKTEILTINFDDEGIEISCDDDEVELPPEAEASSVVSAIPPVIMSKSLALLLKYTTEKMGNPPSDPSVQNEEQAIKDPKDPEAQPLKRRRRDPRHGVYVEQNKDQPMTDAEDEDGLYDFDFEKDASATATATATDTVFDFDVDTLRMDVDVTSTEILVTTTVTAPIIESTPPVTTSIASSSGTVHEEPCSSSGKRPEEPLRMPFDDDSSDDDECISMREMKKRIVVLEQDSIHKDAKIIQLEDTIVQKNQQIDQLQGDTRRKSEEDRARAFAKDDADRATAMDHYFKKFVVLKNKNLNPDDDDAQATHHLMDGFDHDRRRWWIKRKFGPVEWYKNPAQFQTFTKVDLISLSRSTYVDDQPGGREKLFFERFQREVACGFPSMHTAESIVTPSEGVRDPRTNKRMKIVSWPPADKEKSIPLVKKIPNSALKTMHFWAYDERLGQIVVVCDGEESYRLTDPIDLLNLDQENLEILARSQIRVTEKFESIAKDWTSAVAGVLQIKRKVLEIHALTRG
ncbi:hypothetical protein Hanom_Chr12g01109301 [Helianthus anomalus]